MRFSPMRYIVHHWEFDNLVDGVPTKWYRSRFIRVIVDDDPDFNNLTFFIKDENIIL